MIIGVDFDSTVVCYDELFYRIAIKRGYIPKSVPPTKASVRNYLRKCGKEDVWTKLQGIIYGPEILKASPFAGAIDFFMYCKKHKIGVDIISHKTLHPFLGSKHDLHTFAHKWLEEHGFYDHKKVGMSKKSVFFELTKDKKLDRIRQQKCTYYIDDLPEFLSEQKFPYGVKRILFDPNKIHKNCIDFEHASSWHEIIEKIK